MMKNCKQLKEDIKILRNLLRIQGCGMKAMVVRVDELGDEIMRAKAAAFDMLRGE